MKNMIAFDHATLTGAAWIVDGQRDSAEWSCTRTRREGRAMTIHRYGCHLRRFFRALFVHLDFAFYEGAHNRGGAATAIHHGLIGCMGDMLLLHSPGIEIVEYHTSTIKKFAAGKGNAGKQDVIAAMNRRFGSLYRDGPTANDNIADARAILELGIHDVGGYR